MGVSSPAMYDTPFESPVSPVDKVLGSTEVRHSAESFGLLDLSFALTSIELSNPYLSISEAVRNSCEAARLVDGERTVTVEVRPLSLKNPDDGTVVLDNACGMRAAEMLQYFHNIGSSAKDISASANLGAGAKLVGGYHNERVTVISWVDGRAHKVVFGNTGGNNIRPYNSRDEVTGVWKFVVEVPIPHYAKAPSGTLVHFSDIPFKPFQIMQFLNGRFLELPESDRVVVKVMQVDRGQLMARPVRGSRDLLREMAITQGESVLNGTVRTAEANFHWAIVPPHSRKKSSDFMSHVFQPARLYLCHRGEAVESWTSSEGARQLRQNWGITAGSLQVSLAVEILESGVTQDCGRGKIIGWDEAQAQRAWRENIPPELAAFMSEVESRIISGDRLEKDLVGKLLGLLRHTGPMAASLEESLLGSKPEPLEANDAMTDELAQLRPAPLETTEKRERKPRGYPEFVWVSNELGDIPVEYSSANRSIRFNKDFPTVLQCCKGKTPIQEKIVMALFVTEVMTVFGQHYRQHKSIPDSDVLGIPLRYPSYQISAFSRDPSAIDRLARAIKAVDNRLSDAGE